MTLIVSAWPGASLGRVGNRKGRETMNWKHALAVANGRRRTRLLDESEIVDSAASLNEGDHVFLHGGHVANSYGYPASATVAALWRNKDGVWCQVKEGRATKGCTGFGQHRHFDVSANNGHACIV